MEKQVKETVIGYVDDGRPHDGALLTATKTDATSASDAAAAVAAGSTVADLPAVDPSQSAAGPAAVNRVRRVDSLIRALSRPLSARSPADASAKRSSSTVATTKPPNPGTAVQKPMSERRANANSPPRRPSVTSKPNLQDVLKVANAPPAHQSPPGADTSPRANVRSSSVVAAAASSSRIGRTIASSHSLVDARQSIHSQLLQQQSYVKSSAHVPSRLIPPTQSRLPSETRVSAASSSSSSPRSTAGGFEGGQSSSVDKTAGGRRADGSSVGRESRAAAGRQSLSAAIGSTPKVQMPSRKSSLTLMPRASELKKSDVRIGLRTGGAGAAPVGSEPNRPSKPGWNQSTAAAVHGSHRPTGISTRSSHLPASTGFHTTGEFFVDCFVIRVLLFYFRSTS
jgi:hypothetical protein